jgi:hypothetical protein
MTDSLCRAVSIETLAPMRAAKRRDIHHTLVRAPEGVEAQRKRRRKSF